MSIEAEFGFRGPRHQLERNRLANWLAELEQENGPIAPELIEEIRQAWPAPGEKAAKRRSS